MKKVAGASRNGERVLRVTDGTVCKLNRLYRDDDDDDEGGEGEGTSQLMFQKNNAEVDVFVAACHAHMLDEMTAGEIVLLKGVCCVRCVNDKAAGYSVFKFVMGEASPASFLPIPTNHSAARELQKRIASGGDFSRSSEAFSGTYVC